MSLIGTLAVSIIGDMRGLADTLSQATASVGKFGESIGNVGRKMQDTGKTLSTYVTAPIVGIGTAAVMTVASFDDSMAKVRAISGATADDFQKLRQAAIDLGTSTRYSASEAADAMGLNNSPATRKLAA